MWFRPTPHGGVPERTPEVPTSSAWSVFDRVSAPLSLACDRVLEDLVQAHDLDEPRGGTVPAGHPVLPAGSRYYVLPYRDRASFGSAGGAVGCAIALKVPGAPKAVMLGSFQATRLRHVPNHDLGGYDPNACVAWMAQGTKGRTLKVDLRPDVPLREPQLTAVLELYGDALEAEQTRARAAQAAGAAVIAQAA